MTIYCRFSAMLCCVPLAVLLCTSARKRLVKKKSSPEYFYTPFVNTLSCTCYQTPKFLQGVPPFLLYSPLPFLFSSTIAAFLQKRQNLFSFTSAIFCRVSSSLSSFFSTTQKKRILRNLPKMRSSKPCPFLFNRTRDFISFPYRKNNRSASPF